MRLYLARHGESTANLERVFSNSGEGHPLTDKGRLQARDIAESLIGLQFARIYSSPLRRALETAGIVSEAFHTTIEVAEALREWSVGDYEGAPYQKGWELYSRVQSSWFDERQYDSRMPGGESFNDIRKRFCPFIEQVLADERYQDQSVFLVGHGGLFVAMLPTILNNVDINYARKHGFPNGKYVVAEKHPTGLSCISWCDDSLIEGQS